MVFFGEYQVNIATGGRLVIPKKIRESIQGETFVLTKGFDQCLAGYDLTDWNTKTKDLLNDSLFVSDNLTRKRLIFSAAHFISIDDQGRSVLPKRLLESLPKDSLEMIFIGVGDHFEVWETNQWRNYQTSVNL